MDYPPLLSSPAGADFSGRGRAHIRCLGGPRSRPVCPSRNAPVREAQCGDPVDASRRGPQKYRHVCLDSRCTDRASIPREPRARRTSLRLAAAVLSYEHAASQFGIWFSKPGVIFPRWPSVATRLGSFALPARTSLRRCIRDSTAVRRQAVRVNRRARIARQPSIDVGWSGPPMKPRASVATVASRRVNAGVQRRAQLRAPRGRIRASFAAKT